ncbi:hypothetical protein [Sphingobium olei]|jgi:hypothetical protein|uniref:Uncharacterized protein n=1 Tax=Sphingobium olei TaxID=420955 RepID=A0ABW3P013_9SPHN
MGCKSEVGGEHPGKVSQASHIGVYVQWKGFPTPVKHKDYLSQRHRAVVAAAKAAGLLSGTNISLSARVSRQLIDRAKIRSGVASTTDLVEYALAKVALEDDFGARLVGRKGTIPPDIALGA